MDNDELVRAMDRYTAAYKHRTFVIGILGGAAIGPFIVFVAKSWPT